MRQTEPTLQVGGTCDEVRRCGIVALAVVLALAVAAGASACSGDEASSEEGSLADEELQAMGEMTWPSSGFATALPVPSWAVVDEETGRATVVGELRSDSSDSFRCDIAADEDDYADYVDACMEAGFDGDYYRDDEDFRGTDAEGNELSLSFYAADDEYNDYDCSYLSIDLYASDEEDAEGLDEDDGGQVDADEADDADEASGDGAEAYTVDIDDSPGLTCTVAQVGDDGLTLDVVGSEEAVYLEIYSVVVDGAALDVTDSSEFSIDGLTSDSGVVWGFVEEGTPQQWVISCPAAPDFESMELWFDCRVFTYSSSGAVSNTFDFVELTMEIEKA